MALLLVPLFAVVQFLTACFILASKWTYSMLWYKGLKESVLVCPFAYGCRMLTSSSVLILNVMHGYFNGLHDCSMWILVCWINSINYWRFPTSGFRRFIDIFSSLLATYYHLDCSYEIINGYIYRIGIFTFCAWYCCALYFGRFVGNKHYASICHVNIHSTAIVFNAWFFSQLYEARYLQ